MSTNTTDLLRGELERLFELDELQTFSNELLGYTHDDLGAPDGKGAFARAIVERCENDEATQALADAILFFGKRTDEVHKVFGVSAGAELSPGDELSGIKVLKRLSADGGLGKVYLGEKPNGDGKDRVAIKVIRSSLSRDRSAVARYLTSQRALRRTKISGVAAITDCGTLPDGRPWVATEYVQGQTLQARLERIGPVHINEALPIMVGVLDALTKLHSKGLVHGDVKPSNVFVVREDNEDGSRSEPRGVLVDGGALRLLAGGAPHADKIGTLRVFGKAKAIAPEIARGEAVGPSSDIYAAGVMLYEVLTGKPPFEADSAFELIAKHLSATAEKPSEAGPPGWIPKEIDEVLEKALAKNPADRYPDAQSLLSAINSIGRASKKKRDKKPLDEKAFQKAQKAFSKKPNEENATKIEELAAPANEWEKAVKLYEGGISSAKNDNAKKALWFRIARIQKSEIENSEAAEAAYQKVLEIDSNDQVARVGIEEIKRSQNDHEGLAELLLERAESEEDPISRAGLLREIAQIYDEQLESPEAAFGAWVQALCDDPSDERSSREIERIAGQKQELWTEALTSLSEAAQESEDPEASVPLYLHMGRWYANKLARPDFALPCFSQVLSVEPTNNEAYDGTISLYENAGSWQEYVQVLESRAKVETNPAKARDHRAKAARAILEKLNDQDRAVTAFEGILKDDPGHPGALDALESMHAERSEWKKLATVMEQRIAHGTPDEKVTAHLSLGELHEDRLDDIKSAVVQYELARKADPASIGALKGLERVYSRSSDYKNLLPVLEEQLELMPTPRQKIAVLEHIGAIHEEEFVDHEKAMEIYERIIAIDPAQEAANVALTRIYRQQQRFEDLVKTQERHAGSTADETRKIDILMQAAKTLLVDMSAPERSKELCSRVLAVKADHSDALDLMANIQASSGDAAAAVEAVDRMAESENDATKRASLFVRAGKLMQESGDADRAIDRYKRALDADPDHALAASSLRSIYGERGDAHGAADLLVREIKMAEGDIKKAGLYAELGRLYHERLEDSGKAREHFETAIGLDGTSTPALRGLGDMAFDADNWSEAARYYEPLLNRTSEMSDEDAKRLSLRCGDSFRNIKDFNKAQRAYLNAKAYGPNDRDVLERVADVTFESGEPAEAAELYRELMEKVSDLSPDDRARVLYRRGESSRRAGSLKEAVLLLNQASELKPEDAKPSASLRKIHAEKGEWDKVVRVARRRMEQADEDERFDLLVEVGDTMQNNLKDRTKAANSYVAALEIKPDERNLLTKLMGVYSETKDWSKLVEVILRIAELVNDPKQLSKYLLTAASIASSQLNRPEEAADYYERALEHDPSLDKAFKGLIDSHSKRDDYTAVANAYRAQIVRKRSDSPESRANLWDALGALYKDKLDDSDKAVDAYEEANKLQPGDRKRAELLAELYATNPERHGRKAADGHRELLALSPYRIESYQALRELFTDLKQPDQSWCVCQALHVLKMAGADETLFFKKHRSKHPAEAQEFFNEDIWFNNIIHHSQDPLLTQIFATITPAVTAERSQPIATFKVTGAKKNPESDPSAMAQTLAYVSGVTQVNLPEVFYRESDGGGLSVLFTETPAIGLGKGALAGGPPKALAFVAARHLSYYRAGHYLRHLVPTGGGLRNWLLASISKMNPQFPIPAKAKDEVLRNKAALDKHLSAQQGDKLRSLVTKLLAAAPELDMKRWVTAVDRTADRVGFVMSNDLEISAAVIKASPDSEAARKERLKDLYLYCVSDEYMQLRQKLGVAIGS